MAIADNITVVKERINRAAEHAGRTADEITLVAVSKQRSMDAITEAYNAGLRHFGENRAYELQEKGMEIDLDDLQWHFIGHLQKRQSKPVAQHATVFHAVDRVKIAKRLSKQRFESPIPLSLFIEVNVSGEETKGGFRCAEWEADGEQQENLCAAVEQIAALPNVALCGLMTMAPWGEQEAVVRSVFARTRRLAEWLNDKSDVQWSSDDHRPALSIGMTDDYEIAIEEGATHVRVGRAIFGERY